MKGMKNIRKKAGISAVIVVILMTAITVAIAATVYIYASNLYNRHTLDQENNIVINGTLHGIIFNDDAIIIGNNTYYNISICAQEREYLFGMLGQNITLILTKHPTIYDDTVVYNYEFVWAYVN